MPIKCQRIFSRFRHRIHTLRYVPTVFIPPMQIFTPLLSMWNHHVKSAAKTGATNRKSTAEIWGHFGFLIMPKRLPVYTLNTSNKPLGPVRLVHHKKRNYAIQSFGVQEKTPHRQKAMGDECHYKHLSYGCHLIVVGSSYISVPAGPPQMSCQQPLLMWSTCRHLTHQGHD